MADEDAEQEVRRALDVVQSMIDISADRLEGLRTQCATSAELTQHEIRTLEVSVNTNDIILINSVYFTRESKSAFMNCLSWQVCKHGYI